jgi:hypothetical protein
MLFTFAGSTHTNYVSYLLEMICNLELESSQELREAILTSMVVNLSGEPGRFAASDFIQEFLNRCLEAIVKHKSAEFGDGFIRNIISLNLAHIARLKADWKEGLGLSRRAGKHSDPHTNPEIRILLQEYQHHELHRRRPGRMYDGRDTDDFTRGMLNLRNGKLKSWISMTTTTRGVRKGNTEVVQEHSEMNETTLGLDFEPDLEDQDIGGSFSEGSMRVEDGELIIEMAESDEVFDQCLATLAGDGGVMDDDDSGLYEE